jgi:L-2-hydroxyglutarate oxidase LhgO
MLCGYVLGSEREGWWDDHMERVDVAVIGSGAVGLAVARGLLEIDPTIRISVFEKEQDFSTHASARNSGVLHAGFYYSPESLKARFCREGRDELERLAVKNSIPIKKIGKVVVAQNREEEARLETLLKRGIANGVELERLPESELSNFEPLARTEGSFLWSPNTTVSNPVLINEALRSELISKNVKFISNSKVEFIDTKWINNNEVIPAKYFINAGGAWALDLAHQMKLGLQYRTMPFLGLYKQVQARHLPIRTLIYPVPHPINPFLGVHFTLTIDGFVKIGPSALPIIGRSQYSLNSPITSEEILTFGKNLISLAKGSKHDLWSMVQYEIPKLLTSNLVGAASELVPGAKQVKQWSRKSPGIRGQLINSNSGELLQDFLIEHNQNSTHVLNAVSPGWTASIPFGRHIAQMVVERLDSIT